MSGFTSFRSYHLADIAKRLYQLDAPLRWNVGRKDSGLLIEVPRLETFDISVPKGLGWLQSRDDRRVLLPAAIHDFLLREGFDVAFASGEFRRALLAMEVPAWRCWALYAATLLWTAIRRKPAQK